MNQKVSNKTSKKVGAKIALVRFVYESENLHYYDCRIHFALWKLFFNFEKLE